MSAASIESHQGDTMKPGMALDYLIACTIWESDRVGKPVWLNRLERLLEGKASRSTISKNLSKLFDYGVIDDEWSRNGEGSWVRTFHITAEASALVEKIFRDHGDDPDLMDVRTRIKSSV